MGNADRIKLHGALVILQLGFAGFEILARNVLIGGFSPYVFPVYRNAIAFVVLAPLAYFLESNKRPKMRLQLLPLFLVTGTIGIFFNQVAYIMGLRYTSAAFTSAYRNSMPVFTFILSTIIGLEEVNIRRTDGQAKVFGITFGVLGALVMSLFRGPELLKPPSLGISLVKSFNGFHITTWDLGVLFLTAAFVCFAVFLILQAQLIKKYPAPLSIATISIAIGGLELALFACICEPERSRWALTSMSTVTAVVYAGVVASGLVSAIQSWGVQRGGPVIVASYQPLETVAVAVLGFVILKEGFHLGSLIGAILVVTGLYSLIWGQMKHPDNKEENIKISLKRPLLSETDDYSKPPYPSVENDIVV